MTDRRTLKSTKEKAPRRPRNRGQVHRCSEIKECSEFKTERKGHSS